MTTQIDPLRELSPEELGHRAAPFRAPCSAPPAKLAADAALPIAEPSGEEIAVDFLQELRPGGPWVLTAIIPDGGTTTITARTANEARSFVRAHNGKRNLYYSVNPTRKPTTKKPTKTDIAAIEFILADLDPADEKETPGQAKTRYEKALKNVPKASAVIDSGNGLQGLWRLEKPIPLAPSINGEWPAESELTIADVEARTKALMERLGTKAGTQNIDRILRLPGTVNLPNAKKRREGRVECAAKLLEFNGTTHPLDAFPLPAQAASRPSKGRPELPHIDFNALPDVDFSALQVSDEIRAAIDSDGGDLGKGDRSTGMARVACELARAGLSDQEIASVLWHEPIGAHARDRADRERAIRRVIAYARKSDALNEFAAYEESEEAEHHAQKSEWGEPDDLWEKHTDQPAALPPDTVPNLVCRFAADRGRRLGVEPGAPAAALITTLGSLVPAEATIQPRQRDTKWKVKPILWTMLIGAPSSNKTAVLAQAMEPIYELEREWRADFKRAKSRHQATREFPSIKSPKTQRASAVLEDIPTAAEPRCRRKIANDATTEALAALLAENPGGLLYFTDELSGLFGSMDVYRPRGGKDRAFWLQAKDGGPITVDRKTQGSVYAPNCAVSVFGGIQPDKLSTIASNLTNDGLLQRFTPVFVGRKSDGEDIEPDEDLDQLVLAVARGIAASSAGRYRLSPEADTEFQAVLRFKNNGIDREDADPIACQWLGKLPNEFARIALVFHFIEWFSREDARLLGDDPPEIISVETARRAHRYLTEFVYGHAQRLYRAVGDDAIDEHARWIGGLILSRGLEEINERTVYRARTALQSREKRSAVFGALRVLELFDWVRPTAFRPNGQAKCWSVNPAVHDGRFADRAASEQQRRADFREKMKRKGGTQ